MAEGRNLKGENGQVKIETLRNGDRAVKISGDRIVTLRQKTAEELLAALTTSLRPWAGYSIMGRIVDELDVVLDRLMSGNPAADDRDPGRAEALTTTLAIMRNPYKPDYPGERKRALERWEVRNEQS